MLFVSIFMVFLVFEVFVISIRFGDGVYTVVIIVVVVVVIIIADVVIGCYRY